MFLSPLVHEVRVSVSKAKAKLNDLVRRKVIESVMETVRTKKSPGPDAARSQDFLYDSEGLPK